MCKFQQKTLRLVFHIYWIIIFHIRPIGQSSKSIVYKLHSRQAVDFSIAYAWWQSTFLLARSACELIPLSLTFKMMSPALNVAH